MNLADIIMAICSIITTSGIILGVLLKRLNRIDQEFINVRNDLRILDSRISKIEGYILGKDVGLRDRNGTEH